jgi:RNA polymerase sigma-70 factor, ECF subfamily
MNHANPASQEPDDGLRAAFDTHRRDLHAHCYRLAGNVADADDLVQETYLRAWKSRDAFEGRASVRTWLYRIATNLFLDSRKAAQARTQPAGDIFEWDTQLGPYPDRLLGDDPQAELAAAELVELALIAALMYLPARQRVAFLLRDLHGWTPAEIADLLDIEVAAANGLLQRARETIRRHAPDDPRDWRRPELTAKDKEILRRYANANDRAEMRDLLADEVRITMPPDPAVIGADAAADFLTRPLDWRSIEISANGRPALANYLRRPGSPMYEALVVDVLRIVDGRIVEINAFVGGHHVTAFGLTPTIEP